MALLAWPWPRKSLATALASNYISLDQSCPWVGLTHGLGWVWSGWVEIYQLLYALAVLTGRLFMHGPAVFAGTVSISGRLSILISGTSRR